MKKRILLLTEKPAHDKLLLTNKIMKEYLKNNEYETYNTMMISTYSFKYPENIQYKDYPKTNNIIFNKDLKYKNEYYIENYKKTTKDFFSSFDELILSPDPDHTGVYSAIITLEETLGENWQKYFKKIIYLNLFNYQQDLLSEQLKNVLFLEDKGKRLLENKNKFKFFYEQGKIKRYFEYNYNINSNIFFKEILKSLNIKYEKTLTKYIIMTINYIYKEMEETFSESELLTKMSNYKGSGKYKNSNRIFCKGIGGVASRVTIIDILKNLSFLEKDKNNKNILKKTKFGNNFYHKLHKKTFDVDLTYRLNNWMELPFEEAKDKIDKYLIDIFKKQKRKNRYL